MAYSFLLIWPFLVISAINYIPVAIAYWKKAKYKKIHLYFFGLNEILIIIYIYISVIGSLHCPIYCDVNGEMTTKCPPCEQLYDVYTKPLFVFIVVIFVMSFILSLIKNKKIIKNNKGKK
jgi:uncharacterized protein with PQ loop repeat